MPTAGSLRAMAANFKLLRQEKGLSQPALGRLVGVNPSTVSRWETLHRAFESHYLFVKALHELDITASEFFGLVPPVD